MREKQEYSKQEEVKRFFREALSEEGVEKGQQQLLKNRMNPEQEEALKQLWKGLEGAAPASDAQKQEAWRRLRNGMGEERSAARRSFMRRWMQYAALWVLPLGMVVMGLFLYHQTKVMKEEMGRISMVQQYVAPGQIRTVTLPDSTQVWLNSGSLLTYPSQFTGKNREVYLSGEGYFEVTRNEKKPFIVKTCASQIRVLGTHFNVSAYPEDARIVTTLTEGSVAVDLKDRKGTFLLVPDEQLVHATHTGEAFKQKVDTEKVMSWRNEELAFSNEPFNEVMNTLQRHYNVRIHVASSHYEKSQLTIHLQKEESLANVLKLIHLLIPDMKYEIYDNEVYIE